MPVINGVPREKLNLFRGAFNDEGGLFCETLMRAPVVQVRPNGRALFSESGPGRTPPDTRGSRKSYGCGGGE